MLPETKNPSSVRTGWTILVWVHEDTATPFKGRCFSFYVSFLYVPSPQITTPTHIHFLSYLTNSASRRDGQKKRWRFEEDEGTRESVQSCTLIFMSLNQYLTININLMLYIYRYRWYRYCFHSLIPLGPQSLTLLLFHLSLYQLWILWFTIRNISLNGIPVSFFTKSIYPANLVKSNF